MHRLLGPHKTLPCVLIYKIVIRAVLQILEYLLHCKNFGTQIVKLLLMYSLRLRDPAYMVHLPSGSDTMKAIEFDWKHSNIVFTITRSL